MNKTMHTRIIEAAKQEYVDGDIRINEFERIVGDALDRKEELNDTGRAWARFVEEHDLDKMNVLEDFTEPAITYI